MIRALLGIVLAILIGYGILKAWPLIAGPSLTIHSPADNGSFKDGVVIVSGKATRIAMLTLDGAPLLRDEQGNFSSTSTFPHGGSVLTFVAVDQFGRRITRTRSIFIPD